MEIELKENESIDELEIKNMKIIQNKKGFCFGIDSILLSNFAKEIKDGSVVVDLGSGTGILSILLCAKTNLSQIIGLEIQKDVAEMSERSVKLNNLQDKCKIINMDIKNVTNPPSNEMNKLIGKNKIDYIITNPPYKKRNTGKINVNENKLISRHEWLANLDDFIEAANYLLKDKGILFMVHRPERLVDIVEKMRREKIEPKEIRFIYPKKDESPNLILIKGVKNGKPFLKIDKPLYIYNKNGEYSDEIIKIYKNK